MTTVLTQHAVMTSPATRCHSASVAHMTERARRPRGSAKGNPVVYGHVAIEAKAVVDNTADTLGISQARAIELILLALPLDSDGVPTLLDRTQFDREELPIPAA
jgi:hypothetical protein